MGLASRPATTRTQWMLWLVLTTASLGGIGAIMALVSPFSWANVPLEHYPWALSLRMQWMPTVGVLGMISPLLALAALFLRFGRGAAFFLVVLCVALQFGYVGLETYWKTQERAGAFAQDDLLTKSGGRKP